MSTTPIPTEYSRALIELAHSYGQKKMAGEADIFHEMQSKLCGSVVAVGLKIQEGVIADFSLVADSDALGRASCAIVGKALAGTPMKDIPLIAKAAKDAVVTNQPVPNSLGQEWAELDILRGLNGFPQRHASTLLVFEVLEACYQDWKKRHET